MSVYFAEAGGYTKIGYSADPIRRAVTLTTNGKRPDDLPRGAVVDLIGWVPGDRHREEAIRAPFLFSRVAGEWFHRIDRDVIDDLIWADPRGVHLYRMSALAVFHAMRYPGVSRDEIEATPGIPLMANPSPIEDLLRVPSGVASMTTDQLTLDLAHTGVTSREPGIDEVLEGAHHPRIQRLPGVEALLDGEVGGVLGDREGGIKSCWEQIRWQYGVTTGDTFKANNDFTSRAARLLIERRPDLAAAIELRGLRAA